jgi:hypothetical protein
MSRLPSRKRSPGPLEDLAVALASLTVIAAMLYSAAEDYLPGIAVSVIVAFFFALYERISRRK